MIDDFRPASEPAKSLRAALDGLPETKTSATEKTTDEVFQTPEEVAAAQTLEKADPAAAQATPDPSADPGAPATKLTPSPGNSWRQKLTLSWPPGKKEYIAAAVVVILLGGGFAAWSLTRSSPPPPKAVHKAVTVKKVLPPTPTTVPSALTGLPVSPSLNQLPVTGVMIENSDFARPQSGLGQAGVVFEAIAEGGITRFLALFQDTSPANVGPIRSARPYYEQWALGFDAGYAHVGGSPEALADIKTWNVRDLDEFYNSGYYHRISSRQAPHNVYTAITTLNQLETKKGYTGSTFTSFPRKVDAPAKQPTAKTINLTLSGPDFNVAYAYSPVTNSYARSEGGAVQMDANTNTQVSPKVVIALVMHYSLEADGYHSDYTTIGSGPVYVFQDGTVTTGQWTKGSNAGQFTFTGSDGKPIKLNAGQSWLTAVATTNDVSYTP